MMTCTGNPNKAGEMAQAVNTGIRSTRPQVLDKSGIIVL